MPLDRQRRVELLARAQVFEGGRRVEEVARIAAVRGIDRAEAERAARRLRHHGGR